MKAARVTKSSNDHGTAMIPAFEPSDLMPHKPFPEMPCRIAPRAQAVSAKTHFTLFPKSYLPRPEEAASAPIPLPESHVRRTPSELQLEVLDRHAEAEDICMYSRLLRGMIYRGCSHGEDRGDVHCRTMESVRGIVKTRFASDQELELQGSNSRGDNVADHDLYVPIVGGLVKEALLPGTGPKGSLRKLSMPHAESCNPEHDCVFVMEL